jgi:hypothetical protein
VETRDITNLIDVHEWNLLHIAAYHGSFKCIPELIRVGLDPHSMSVDSADHIPSSLQDSRLSPGDIAEYHGLESLERYCKTLRDAGLNPDLDRDGDIFWDT